MHCLGTGSCGLRQQCIWLNVVHVIHLRQDRLECWQGGLDHKGTTDRRMAPSGRACKRWDDSARRWHGQELDGCKASLWALSWRGQGNEAWHVRQPGMCAGMDAGERARH
ncbi:hypothetical protein HAX54_044906 [Datura stramonium]|uniref:Uncharacterized protein n=1 Tax=Datura stramonium TaxID=4076 RepID=A0ABS8SQ08_DATST|nr:hypothetical protein [Datura stramonium]